jgi:hypothetical protein
VLLVALMAVAMMTIQGSIALSTSFSNISRSIASRASTDTSANVEAGITEARARLMGLPATNPKLIGDPLATLNLVAPAPNPLWSAYVLTSSSWSFANDPGYNVAYTNYIPVASLTTTTIAANSVQNKLPYWAKIRHKREFDAEQDGHSPAHAHYLDGDGSTATHTAASPGNFIYYGYIAGSSTPREFTTAGATSFPPVEIVKSYSGSGSTQKAVQVYMAHDPGPALPSAIFSEGNVTFNNGGSYNGTDNCGVASAKPPVYTKNPATTAGVGWTVYQPSAPTSGPIDFDIQGAINTLKAGATVLTADPPGGTYGSATNYVTVYSNTSSPLNVGGLKLQGVTGYGLLLVDGDLDFDDTTYWYGLVYVTGTVTFEAKNAHKAYLYGGLLAGGSVVSIDNGMVVNYDSCQIAKAMVSKPLKALRWRRL